MKLLISSGAKINNYGKAGSTALYHAVVSGKYEAVKLLLSKGANPYTRIDKHSALQAAGDWQYYDIVRILEDAQRAAGPDSSKRIYRN